MLGGFSYLRVFISGLGKMAGKYLQLPCRVRER
jgi:hypothetical protein